jgi:outer membrane protein, multidrug efflux system
LRRVWALAGLSTLCSACLVGPNYQRPPVTPPAQYRDERPGQDAASLADLPWWTVFQDPVLVKLLSEAVENNRDVRVAIARVQQAAALARISKAQLFPALTANANAAYGRGSLTTPTENPQSGAVFEVDAQVTWEADLWGRIRRSNEAAVAQYVATDDGRRAVLVSLVAQIGQNYVTLRQLDAQREIARRTVVNYERTLQLYIDQFRGGAGNKLPVVTGQAQVNQARGTELDLERQIIRQENLLSLLLGRPPGPMARGSALEGLQPPAAVPAGLPSVLLERRPDVLQAEHLLVAANANIGVAKADFFPRFSLNALVGLATPDLGNIFKSSSFVWSAGGGASWLAPILQGDTLRANAESASAQWEQAKNTYEQTVLTALGEVANALNDLVRLDGVLQQQEAQVLNLRQAVDLATDRFHGGVSSYLEVTTSQNSLFPAELNLAAVRAQRAQAYVELYRALGGGWQLPAETPGGSPGPGTAPATIPASNTPSPPTRG